MARTAYAAALLALAQPAAAELPSFPCEKLGEAGYQVYDGIGPAAALRPASPVKLRKDAVLARERFPLVARELTVDDAALATDGGKLPALPFRAYRIGGTLRYCSQGSRDSLFGPRDRDGMYAMRCLFDEDGDGRFERFRAHGELVRITRSGKAGAPTGIVPPLHPLPRPLTLVERTDPRPADYGLTPRLVVETRIAGITETALVVRTRAQVLMFPGETDERLGSGGDDERTVTIPLRDGSFPLDSGRSIVLARNGKGWEAALAGPASAPAELQCGGSVVAVAGAFTILHDAGMAIVGAHRLPPS